MALKDSIKSMNVLLSEISKDLMKAEQGNKAASQRVRTNSIKLEKVAKKYRKESVTSEKKGSKKKPAAKKKTAPKKKVAGKKKVPCKKKVTKKKPAKKAPVKANTKKKRR